jgi:hypothetical protein
MPLHLTPQQAKALAANVTGKTGGRKRTTKRAIARNGARTRCTCGVEFTTDAAEDDHVAHSHNRFSWVPPGVSDEQ